MWGYDTPVKYKWLMDKFYWLNIQLNLQRDNILLNKKPCY